ncbi:hypothetical protein [Modestobacter marinus]|uniref:hypothetical protein n=1 Tax=Modestobacter marinus TaxID=477641 RepID=UPI001C98C730|nr:hypothetical protein [Modestobacter marinus]
MLRHSPRLRAVPASRGSRSEREAAARNGWLRDHLIREHGRTERELQGMDLEDLHRFEHVEQELGLIELSHRHADAFAEVDELPIPA